MAENAGVSNNQGAVLPEREPMPIVDESGLRTYQDGEWYWLQFVLYLVAALIFAFFLVLAGRGIYHRYHHKQTVTTVAASNNIPPQPNSSSASSSYPQGNQPSGSSGGNSSTQPAPAPSTPKTQPRPSPSPSQLPNNGPGNVAAVFIGTSLVAGSLHYIISLRKNKLT